MESIGIGIGATHLRQNQGSSTMVTNGSESLQELCGCLKKIVIVSGR